MDKETLSNYGWIVICVLVLAVMIALATPFGNFIADGFKAAFLGFGQTNNSMLDTMYDTTGTPPSLEYLQSKYKFEYYSTMNLAVEDVNNGTIGASADSAKENAVAGIYTDENGGVNVVLLQNSIETATVSPAVDMTINLGGHVLSAKGTKCINILGGNVTIDGRLSGSAIQMEKDNQMGCCVQIPSESVAESVTINGGSYVTYGNYSASTPCIAINIRQNPSNTVVTLNNCYVMGTHSAVQSRGTLYVNGGTYEGYGHGGFYFSGPNATSYVRNATIRECAMPTGYTDYGPGCNNSGIYIGGGSGRDNITVYMDNCSIYGSNHSIVLRGSGGEKNNILYISNSTVNLKSSYKGIRIDNNTHKLYIGTGNNFGVGNTTLPESVFTTNETYAHN